MRNDEDSIVARLVRDLCSAVDGDRLMMIQEQSDATQNLYH